MFGCAGLWPSHGVATIASGVCGVEANFERVLDVKTGVRWMWSRMRLWADCTEERSSGRVLSRDAIAVRYSKARWLFLRSISPQRYACMLATSVSQQQQEFVVG